MRDPGLPPEPEELLRHGSFLRAVVRALLRDEHEVDDVVQDTYVAALGGRHSPGWLTTVARNFARTVRRSERRRRKRERVAARLESVPSAAAMAQRLELQERLVAAVRTLESPYREVVVLRFYEGLPPREIARALGVPVETVRTRLQRALGLLRGRLDRLSEGGRRAWQLVLAPLALKAKPAAAAPLLVGGAVVKTKVTFVVLLLSALFTAIFLANAERPEQAPQREEARKTPAVLDDAEAGEEEEAATVRPQISAVRATDSREPKPETVTPRLKRIVGKPKEQEPPPVGSAAVTGRFRLKGDLPPESVKVLLSGTYKDSEGKWQTFKLERVTNATGEFSFEDLPSAVFTFEA
ncbi:MAG: RNA polymerase sigma factor, partial [Planctomycetota bacterium]